MPFASAKYKSVRARIIGSALNNVDQTVRIGVGASSGIKKGMPVRTAAGLVGRVVEVFQTSSTVMLVTDADMSIGVRFGLTGEVAIARGQGRGDALRLELVALDATVAKGDVVVTSGLQNSRFPPGIPVGRVAAVRPGSISQEVTIRPAVDLSRISFVRVLLRDAPA
jgi:rod shape-determining protein MreC